MGIVSAIFIAGTAGGPMLPVPSAKAVPTRGLEGDRYFLKTGTFWKAEPDHELTLIEIEALEAVKRETNIEIPPELTRRNVLTMGVPLNHLVGKKFQAGAVELLGIRLCEPCKHLVKVSRLPALLGALIHRGGLRVQILNEATLTVGDRIVWPHA